MAKWTEIDTQVVEAGQEVPLDTPKKAVKVVPLVGLPQKYCGNCQWLVKNEGKPYYCAIKDLYTCRESTDEACEEWKDGD